jgi:hypothetical protein
VPEGKALTIEYTQLFIGGGGRLDRGVLVDEYTQSREDHTLDAAVYRFTPTQLEELYGGETKLIAPAGGCLFYFVALAPPDTVSTFFGVSIVVSGCLEDAPAG